MSLWTQSRKKSSLSRDAERTALALRLTGVAGDSRYVEMCIIADLSA